MSALSSLSAAVERTVHTHAARMATAVIALVIAFLWIPIAVLVFMSFAAGGVLSFPPEQLTLEWYRVFLTNDAAIDAIVTTITISVPATIITVTLSTMIAYAIDRYVFPGRDWLQMLATLPIIVPLVVTGVAMVLFFNGTLGLPEYVSVVVAHVIRTIPFATLVILPTFLTFDRRLEEASKDLGADELRTFWQVTLPNIFPGIVAGGLLAFTLSFNEFVYTYFVKGSGDPTLPVYIWNQIRYNVTPEVNVISVVFLVVAVTMVLVAVSLTRVDLLTRQ
ncbi:spermidine/putrescine transport system permease protein [Halopenitus malekzadehii]|uniref:Spermidine/putrescine transport system permease protein n=1 Tax=Halopenitus malekzadehii TaxID=1267564 RepID=A0A1H6JCP3_9EURY|nr:ABC transporter permease [Halopenitus malekzadehii]SEH57395.1 spermidine/putrescine transport system permease protein [Halopenitus malekzadehii]